MYIFLPLDLSHEHVPASLLDKPLDISYPVDTAAQDSAISAIISALSSATNPAVFVDALTQRHNAVSEARALVEKLKLPVYASNMGKAIVDESNPLYVGTMNGKFAAPGAYEALQKADLTLLLGDLPCDTNTGAFSRPITPANSIVVNPFDVKIKGKDYPNTYLKPLLAALVEALPGDWKPQAGIPQLPRLEDCPEHPAHPANAYRKWPAQQITHDWVWARVAAFLRPGDVVIPDTGTSTFGLSDVPFPVGNVRSVPSPPLPPDTQRELTQERSFVSQAYYGSIGWSVPAALGSELALEEIAAAKKRQGRPDAHAARGRTLLFVGDGSLGLTVQEIGTMVQQKGPRPIIFILNNKGYTIERIIHGAHYCRKPPSPLFCVRKEGTDVRTAYNDINNLSYQHLLPLFQHPSPATCYRRCASKQELDAALADPELADPSLVQVVEIVMDKLDVPWRLMEIIKSREGKEQGLRAEGFLE